jgi:uncharacterized damage-inducible protein DinB
MLTRYMAWANDRIFATVAALPEGEATKPRRSVFKNIVHTLNHVYVIDLIFQAHLEGREHGFTARNTPDHPSLDELRGKQRVLDDWYITWSDRLTEPEFERKVHFEFVGGGEGGMTCAEIVMHLVNHTTYHRGYVADMLYQVPSNPPTTDLTVFLRDAPPKLD